MSMYSDSTDSSIWSIVSPGILTNTESHLQDAELGVLNPIFWKSKVSLNNFFSFLIKIIIVKRSRYILTPRNTSSDVTDCLNFMSYSGTILGSAVVSVGPSFISNGFQISLFSDFNGAWGVTSFSESLASMLPGP